MTDKDIYCTITMGNCHHIGTKCSECPLTDLVCDEFNNCVDIAYDAGYERGKAEAKAEHYKECDRCQYSLRKEVIEEVRENATDEFRAKVSKDIEEFAEKVKSQVYDLVIEVEKFAERMKEKKE